MVSRACKCSLEVADDDKVAVTVVWMCSTHEREIALEIELVEVVAVVAEASQRLLSLADRRPAEELEVSAREPIALHLYTL